SSCRDAAQSYLLVCNRHTHKNRHTLRYYSRMQHRVICLCVADTHTHTHTHSHTHIYTRIYLSVCISLCVCVCVCVCVCCGGACARRAHDSLRARGREVS